MIVKRIYLNKRKESRSNLKAPTKQKINDQFKLSAQLSFFFSGNSDPVINKKHQKQQEALAGSRILMLAYDEIIITSCGTTFGPPNLNSHPINFIMNDNKLSKYHQKVRGKEIVLYTQIQKPQRMLNQFLMLRLKMLNQIFR